jgi:zinc/manganese transport system substrate-binding protein
MRRRTLLALLPAFAAGINRAHGADAPQVVATFSILADMASVVAGDSAVVSTLVRADGDAHVWEPRPDDLRRVQRARVLIENGLGLEGWMRRLPEAAGFKGLLVTAARAVTPRKMIEDGHSIIDPHAWQNPQNGILYVRAIADGLAQEFADAAPAIRSRADAYIAEIAETDRWIVQTLAPIPPAKRQILTSHDAFGYYGARYGIRISGVQGISTESEPSAHDIATLVAQIKRDNIRAVFVENMTDPRLAAAVAREAGAVLGPTVYSDALSAKGGPADSYLRMLRHNTTAFATAMAAN